MGGLHGIEDDRRGIGARRLAVDLDLSAPAPLLELLDGGGAERVRGRQHDGLARRSERGRERAEETHDPAAGIAWGGSSSRRITTPRSPRGGMGRPFSVSSIPPALPMVTTKRFAADHSRVAPGESRVSSMPPSSAWMRIQVDSTAFTIKRWAAGLTGATRSEAAAA